MNRLPKKLQGKRVPKIHGHRGARGLYPENTLQSILAAVRLGCDAVEIDVWVSQDDQLIVHHDASLSPAIARDACGKWVEQESLIRDLKAVDLMKYDVGRINPRSDYAGQFPEQTACDGQRIPTLAGVVRKLDEIEARVAINIELKSAPDRPSLMPRIERYVEIATRNLVDLNILERSFIQSFDWRLPLGIKSRLPHVKIGLLSDQNGQYGILGDCEGPCHDQRMPETSICLDDVPRLVHERGADCWSPNFKNLTADLLATAHQLGLEVCVWTVNHPQDMQRMLDMGVDAITTDYPDRLLKLSRRRSSFSACE